MNFIGDISELPKAYYKIIYADPPWRYDFSKDKSDRIENHYPTMTTEDICNIDVPADENAVLYLWATAPKLIDALQVMKAWGFEYKTHCVWDKGWIGMGYWFRGQHELLLVGVKGKFSPPAPKSRLSSMYKENKSKHSRKPRYFRDVIDKQYPGIPKIELFARQAFPGWRVWGNESECSLVAQAQFKLDLAV